MVLNLSVVFYTAMIEITAYRAEHHANEIAAWEKKQELEKKKEDKINKEREFSRKYSMFTLLSEDPSYDSTEGFEMQYLSRKDTSEMESVNKSTTKTIRKTPAHKLAPVMVIIKKIEIDSDDEYGESDSDDEDDDENQAYYQNRGTEKGIELKDF